MRHMANDCLNFHYGNSEMIFFWIACFLIHMKNFTYVQKESKYPYKYDDRESRYPSLVNPCTW